MHNAKTIIAVPGNPRPRPPAAAAATESAQHPLEAQARDVGFPQDILAGLPVPFRRRVPRADSGRRRAPKLGPIQIGNEARQSEHRYDEVHESSLDRNACTGTVQPKLPGHTPTYSIFGRCPNGAETQASVVC